MAPNRPDELAALVSAIHSAGPQFVLAVTGGGASAIDQLLRVPGGSRSLLEAVVPYSTESLVAFLGFPPEHFCDEAAARAMAMAAFARARAYRPDDHTVCGIACTASLASDRPKRGAHRAHLAWQNADSNGVASIELVKGARDRAAEEDLVGRLTLATIAQAIGLTTSPSADLLPGERLVERQTLAEPAWRELLLGAVRAIRTPTSDLQPNARPRAIFSGAFNPRHDGHRAICAIATRLLGVPVEHEISIINVEKPRLDYFDFNERAKQFGPEEPLWFTRAPLFTDKAAIFPGATFIVGADTIERIANHRYYENDPSRLAAAVAEFARHGCRFLVFGRMSASGFQSLTELKLPAALAELCQGVPAEVFRHDISSTELRRK